LQDEQAREPKERDVDPGTDLGSYIDRLRKTLGPQLAPQQWARALAVAEKAQELTEQGKAAEAELTAVRARSLLRSIEEDHRMSVDAHGNVVLGAVTLHKGSRALSFPGKLRLESEMYVELIACTTGADRAYETLLTTPARAIHLQTMLVLSGARNGPVGWGLPGERQGDVFDIELEYTGADGKALCRPVEDFLRICENGEAAPRSGWVFVGSSVHEGRLIADITGELILSWRSGPSIIQSADPNISEGSVQIEATAPDDVGEGAEMRIILKPRRKPGSDSPKK